MVLARTSLVRAGRHGQVPAVRNWHQQSPIAGILAARRNEWGKFSLSLLVITTFRCKNSLFTWTLVRPTVSQVRTRALTNSTYLNTRPTRSSVRCSCWRSESAAKVLHLHERFTRGFTLYHLSKSN